MEAVGVLIGVIASLGVLFGLVNIIYPIRTLGVRDRKWGAAIVGGSFLLIIIGSAAFPFEEEPEEDVLEASDAVTTPDGTLPVTTAPPPSASSSIPVTTQPPQTAAALTTQPPGVTTTTQLATTTTEFIPGIGDAVADGQFQFTVTDFKCGFDELGQGFADATPNGQYCVLSLTVENIGDRPRTYSYSDQHLIDQEERRINSDFEGSFALDSDNFVTDLNPGVRIETAVAFDVSPEAIETDFAFAELHDSAFSFGAEVALDPA